ncbi:MAG: S8 family serine peptidase [Ilumatobacteraceae bacterium]
MRIRGRLLVALAAGTLAVGSVGLTTSTVSISAAPSVDTTSAIVLLKGDPVTTSGKVTRGKNQRVNLQGAATKSYRALLSAQRNDFKRWLQANAPQARVTSSYDLSLNAVSVQLNGTSLATLTRAPQVVTAQYSGLYHKVGAPTPDPDLALIHAVEAWGGAGAAGAGAGVKVAIIDSGIDHEHTCFDDMGDSDGRNNLTNNKVIIAKVFSNTAAKNGFDASAVDSHGTHVAGTVACDAGTAATVDGAVIPYLMSGVAPAALLGNYNVFPGTQANARSEDILNALDAAYADGMQVANMSLGGGASGIQDLLTVAVDNLDRGGMVVAVAAGNDGPGYSTVGSPGSAERALTAGASSVAHQVTASLTIDSTEIPAVPGDFGTPPYGDTHTLDVVEPVSAADESPVITGLSLGCSPLPAVASGDELYAVIARGTCDFTVKAQNAQDAGYAGVVVINRWAGRAFAWGTIGAPSQPTIPAVMVSLDDKDAVLGGGDATLGAPAYRSPFGESNQMGDFSSEGPTDVDARIKPDVVAPGVNVLSSVPGGEFAFYNGTSMATPHLAGAAAVVRGQHPTWTAAQVRSAIVNSADDDALSAFHEGALASDPNLTGSGLLDLAAAVNAEVLLDRVSVSAGVIPSGAGRVTTFTVALTDIGTLSGALSATVDGVHGGATYAASVSGTTLTITVTTTKRAVAGASWATVRLHQDGREVAHLRASAQIA